jgi:hypothetical protein
LFLLWKCVSTDQQVNVAAFFGVIHGRAEHPYSRTLAKCVSGGLAYGLNLVSSEAHEIFFMPVALALTLVFKKGFDRYKRFLSINA